jgi:DNA polymerase/3'-5' exonuclease PolX
MPDRLNEDVAGRLEERRACWRAANTVRHLPRPVSEILEQQGVNGLEALPGAGSSIAHAICDLLARGRLAMLERLRGESEPTEAARKSSTWTASIVRRRPA